MVTKAWRVFGVYDKDGQHINFESKTPSRHHDWSTKESTRIVDIINEDILGGNYYCIVKISRDTEEEVDAEMRGQVSDGIFEDYEIGTVEEIPLSTFVTEYNFIPEEYKSGLENVLSYEFKNVFIDTLYKIYINKWEFEHAQNLVKIKALRSFLNDNLLKENKHETITSLEEFMANNMNLYIKEFMANRMKVYIGPADYEEFLDNEFNDPEVIKWLIDAEKNPELFNVWQKLVGEDSYITANVTQKGK